MVKYKSTVLEVVQYRSSKHEATSQEKTPLTNGCRTSDCISLFFHFFQADRPFIKRKVEDTSKRSYKLKW